MHVKLEEAMTRRQSHLIHFSWVPRCDNVSSPFWVLPYRLDDILNLVNVECFVCIISIFPFTPLFTIYWTQIAPPVSKSIPVLKNTFLELLNGIWHTFPAFTLSYIN